MTSTWQPSRWAVAGGVNWRYVASLLAAEREWGRYFLWVPVALGAGILLFFSAEQEPSLIASVIAACAMAALAWTVRRRPVIGPVTIAVAAMAAGFACAAWRVAWVEAPVLERPLRARMVGIVERIEPRARGYRLWIGVERIEGRRNVTVPDHVRVSVTRKGSAPPLGARVAVTGLWRPPPAPVRPDGYDWSREAYFKGLGAVGTAEEAVQVLASSPSRPWLRHWDEAVAGARRKIADRIASVIPGPSGAIAVSLVVGERGPIPQRINEAMRISGLSHVLSISGLHMALFAGAIFWAVRIGLALTGAVALRQPIKKWAALCAAIAAYGYLLLSGADVAAQRSFLMALLGFMAVMIGRTALSVRSVALAAICIVVVMPEMLLSISFQMSFMAVVALVAVYERWQERRASKEGEKDPTPLPVRIVKAAMIGIIVTTLVAGLATMLFGAFYFQRTGTYSLLANMLALPIVSTIIMPSAVLGLALYPFGLDAPAWSAMGLGVDIMTSVAERIAALPGAAWHTVAFGPAALLLITFAILWGAIWRTAMRWLAVIPLGIGLSLAITHPRADVFVDAEGRAMAVRHPDGLLRITGIRFARFAADSWLAADGDRRTLTDRSITADVPCDRFGCRFSLPNGDTATLAWTYHALREDCDHAALVVTRLKAPPACKAFVIDGDDLAARGAISLTLGDGSDIRMDSVRSARAQRAWHNRPKTRTPDFPEHAEIGTDNLDAPSDAQEEAEEPAASPGADEPDQ